MAQDEPLAIIVKELSKTFVLPHEKHSGIKQAVTGLFKGKGGYEKQKVLTNVDFEVKKGEFFAIVGKNGSGKSTLLKLLADIYTPDKGSVQVNGRLTPFIELGVGFNPELTGRENVFLNGALLGLGRKEVSRIYNDIVAFAELEKFMDQKLKNYSSGMQVRLAFSIAIRAQSDILLIDEVLAVGDAAFQQKCYGVFSELKKQKRTMVLITHDMSAVLRFCDRAMLVDKGTIIAEGNPKDVAEEYLQLNYDSITDRGNPNKPVGDGNNGDIKINKVSVIVDKVKTQHIKSGDVAKVIISFSNKAKTPVHFGVQFFNESGNYCFGTNTNIMGISPSLDSGSKELEVELSLVQGSYTVTIAIMDQDANSVISYKPNAASFRIVSDIQTEGIANLKHEWIK